MPGEQWAKEITIGIESTEIMALIYSSNTSKSKHVDRELFLADEKGCVLVPIMIENIDPQEAYAYFFAGKHRINAFGRDDSAIVKTAEQISAFLKGPFDNKRNDNTQRNNIVSRFISFARHNATLLVNIIVLLLVTVIAIGFFFPSQPPFPISSNGDGKTAEKTISSQSSSLHTTPTALPPAAQYPSTPPSSQPNTTAHDSQPGTVATQNNQFPPANTPTPALKSNTLTELNANPPPTEVKKGSGSSVTKTKETPGVIQDGAKSDTVPPTSTRKSEQGKTLANSDERSRTATTHPGENSERIESNEKKQEGKKTSTNNYTGEKSGTTIKDLFRAPK